MMITWYKFSWEPLDTYKFKNYYNSVILEKYFFHYVRRNKLPKLSLVQMNNFFQSCHEYMILNVLYLEEG